MKTKKYIHDVFLSHAVEDRAIATELWEKLRAKGLEVWYSGNELKVGDALTEAIHENLESSRFGVIVLSPTYLSKIWTLNEFFFLQKREEMGIKTLLPVLYKMTPAELAAKFPPMANIFAIQADRGIDDGVEKILNEIKRLRNLDKEQSSLANLLVHNKNVIVSAILAFILAII